MSFATKSATSFLNPAEFSLIPTPDSSQTGLRSGDRLARWLLRYEDDISGLEWPGSFDLEDTKSVLLVAGTPLPWDTSVEMGSSVGRVS